MTLTYGISYELEMPPYELNGKQVSLVDPDGNPVDAADYLAQRKKAALAGQVYQPVLGFATTPNIEGPQVSLRSLLRRPQRRASRSPGIRNSSSGLLGKLLGENKTVIRGGYGRIYGRLNGVNLLLVPLLPPGLLQAVSCVGVSRTGQCLGSNGVDPSTAFRIGVDGNSAPLPAVSPTLPQPYYPGRGRQRGRERRELPRPQVPPGAHRQRHRYLQRQISEKMSLEVGYVGRIIRNEMEALNLDAVPYMTTLGGQTLCERLCQDLLRSPVSGTLARLRRRAAVL